MSRYARQVILPEVGQAGQDKLAASRVTVIGAGGLAASLLPLLAGAGIGTIRIYEGDRVDLTNLHRQTLFGEDDCGALKAEVAATRLRALNAEVRVEVHPEPLTPSNVVDAIAGSDLVADCADSFAVSYTLSDACLKDRVPLVTASALGFEGYVAGVCGGAPSLRALFPEAPQNAANCATAGVMGPLVSAIGAMQAQMALSSILGLEPSPLGLFWRLDARSFRTASFRFDGAEEPERLFPFVAADVLRETDTIIELRSADEAPVPAHASAQRVGNDRLQDALPETRSGRLALCCQTGLRAWRAADTLKDQWPGEIVLVAATAS